MQDVFTEFAILLFATGFIGLIALRLKQALIVGFIAVGVALGPSTLVRADDQIKLFQLFFKRKI